MSGGATSGGGELSVRTTPRLIVITDAAVAPEPVLEARIEATLERAVPGSVVVQLRDHELTARRRLCRGRRLLDRVRRHGQYLVVNDRLDLALALGADGVHLGERSVEPAEARVLLGPAAWISRACHDPRAARGRGADAVLLSPILASRKGRPALGLPALGMARQLAIGGERSAWSAPLLYALGGIDAEGAAHCLASGADGVAVVGAALDGRDPGPLVEALGIAA